MEEGSSPSSTTQTVTHDMPRDDDDDDDNDDHTVLALKTNVVEPCVPSDTNDTTVINTDASKSANVHTTELIEENTQNINTRTTRTCRQQSENNTNVSVPSPSIEDLICVSKRQPKQKLPGEKEGSVNTMDNESSEIVILKKTPVREKPVMENKSSETVSQKKTPVRGENTIDNESFETVSQNKTPVRGKRKAKTTDQRNGSSLTECRRKTPVRGRRKLEGLEDEKEKSAVGDGSPMIENLKKTPLRGKRKLVVTECDVKNSTQEDGTNLKNTPVKKTAVRRKRKSGETECESGETAKRLRKPTKTPDDTKKITPDKLPEVCKGKDKVVKNKRVRVQTDVNTSVNNTSSKHLTESESKKRGKSVISRKKTARSSSCSRGKVSKDSTHDDTRKTNTVNGSVETVLPAERGTKRTTTIPVCKKKAIKNDAKKMKSGNRNRSVVSIPPFPKFDFDNSPDMITEPSSIDLSEAFNVHLKDKTTVSVGKKMSKQVPEYCDRDLCDDTTTHSSSLSSSDEDDDDDDDDLPDVFSTPSSGPKAAHSFKSEDIVWAKLGKWPSWPAIIKSLQKKKHKASVYFIGYPQTKIRGISVNIKNLKLFNCPDRETYIALGSNMKHPASGLFLECVQMVDDYFRKRGLGTVTVTSPLEYFKEDEVDDVASLAVLPFFADTVDASEDEEEQGKEEKKMEKENERGRKITNGKKNPKIIRRGTSCQRKMQKLLDFITKKDIVKDKLIGVANGIVQNERHNIYMHGPNSRRKELKHTGFGPMIDENQQEELFRFLQSLYDEHVLEKTGGLSGVTYIAEVWIPEAILMAIEAIRHVSRKRAVEIFFQEGDYHQAHNLTDIYDFPSIPKSSEKPDEIIDCT